ncbi:MAG TPA: ROK family protein [Firmicutes bacterium]|nr:ROK family protein [Bacillota bacterium]
MSEFVFAIGIDLGGTNIVASAVTPEGRLLSKVSCKTSCPRPYQEICEDMARLAEEAATQAGFSLETASYIGIGSPGLVNKDTGVVEYANNLGFHDAPIADEIKKRTGRPVYLENDANAAALGEYKVGAGRGTQYMIAVTLGTGVGSGIIIDGKIYSGFNFAGAEIGHTVIHKNGYPCTCGMHGCLEAYTSATALIRLTKEQMNAHPESLLWKLVDGDLNNVNGKTAFDGLRAGDATATAIIEEYTTDLGIGFTNIINIFQPEVLCVGGGICHEGDTLLDPVRAYVDRYQYARASKNKTKIIPATLGNDAGIIGAGLLGF